MRTRAVGPHPATVAGSAWRAPHPAKVAQRRPAPVVPKRLPPHPAKVGPGRSAQAKAADAAWLVDEPGHGRALQLAKKHQWQGTKSKEEKKASGAARRRAELAAEPKEDLFADYDWGHTLGGEVKTEKKKKWIVGGHCRTACEANGFTVTVIEQLGRGFYEGSIADTNSTAKKERSTFFPDGWSEEQIKVAITTADRVGNELEITTKHGKGIRLKPLGDFYHPVF